MSDTKATNPADRATGLVLESKNQADQTPRIGPIEMTPLIDEDYWTYRVRLTEKQAIVGFPKFGTVGIGFAKEGGWNTNLPFTSDADDIFKHIAHNKGDDPISDEDCVEAIRMVQDAAWRERGVVKLVELAERMLNRPQVVDRGYAERVIANVHRIFCEVTS